MNNLRTNWIDFITTKKPNVFLTLTFKQSYEMTDKKAFGVMNRLIHYVNSDLFGRNYKKHHHFITGFGCVEYQANQTPHFHLLLVTHDQIEQVRNSFNRKLQKFPQLSSVGFDFQEISDAKGVAGYVTKTVNELTSNRLFPLSIDGVSQV